jgi:hypothetical protein
MEEFINIAKSGSILIRASILLLLLGIFSCTRSDMKDFNGTFVGADGSNKLPSQVDWIISATGDGLISGIWNSKGEVTKGQLSGKLGYFGNELVLYVESGNCLGQFRGNFTMEKGELKGVLKDNSNCPDRSYAFSLQKTH